MADANRRSRRETTFLSGPNAAFIEELYARYARRSPTSVDPSWRAFFAELGEDGGRRRWRT